MKSVLLLALSLAVVYAHVQGVYDAVNFPTLNYRNAQAAGRDGQFSVAGPCGGSQQFGRTGITQVTSGTALTLAMRYNGGHANPANAFRITMECYGATMPTTDNGLKGNANNLACQGGQLGQAQTTPCAVPVNSQSSVYTLSFTFPATAGGATIADKSYCTVSIIDFPNDWGTCVDFQYNLAAVTPPSNPNTNLNVVSDQTGTYTAPDAGPACDKSQDGSKCCCMHGSLQLTHNMVMGGTYNTGTLTGTLIFAEDAAIGCKPINMSFTSGGMSAPIQWAMQAKPGQAAVLVGNQQIQGLLDTLQANAVGGTVQITNVAGNGNSPPRVCSNAFHNAAAVANYFRAPQESLSTTNSTAAAVMIPLVILGIAALLFVFRAPIQGCLNNATGGAGKFQWVTAGLCFLLLVLVMATVVSDHWSKTSGVFVGPWKACTETGDCQNTIDAIAGGAGNVQATRFFMLVAVLAAWAMLALPFLAHFGKLDAAKASTATFWTLIFIGVCTFVSMCVWAAYQYDTLAKFNLFGSWMPDWALGLCCLSWLVAFSTSVVAYVWKLKSGGGGVPAKMRGEGNTSAAQQPAASYPVPQQAAYSQQAAYPTAQPLSYPTPQPLQQYETRPGVDV